MYNVALYIHLLTVAGAFFGMGIMLNSFIQLRSVHRCGEALRCAQIAANAAKIMPIATVLLLLTGGYMTHERWTWGTSWIVLSIIGLLAVTFVGAVVLGSRERALHKTLSEAKGEVVDADVAAQMCAPMFITGSGLNAGIVCGVMFVMVSKPDFIPGIAALVIGAVAGAAIFGLAVRPRTSVGAVKAAAE